MADAVPLQSPTLEGQLLEIVDAIINLENNPQTNPEELHSITGQWQVVKNEFSYQANFNIKALKVIREDGSLVIEPYLYLNNKVDEYPL